MKNFENSSRNVYFYLQFKKLLLVVVNFSGAEQKLHKSYFKNDINGS